MTNNLLHLASVPSLGTLYAKYSPIVSWSAKIDYFLLQNPGEILLDTTLTIAITYSLIWFVKNIYAAFSYQNNNKNEDIK